MNAIGDFLSLTLSSMAPIVVAAMGGMLAERARATNIALDGTMLMSALAAVWATHVTGNPWMGLVAAAVVGILYSLLVAFAAFGLRCDIIIAGIAINLLATGLTYLILQNVLKSSGNYSPPGLNLIPRVNIPGLDSVPIIGRMLANQSALLYVVLALVVLSAVLLEATRFGLRVKAVGEADEAATAVGIRVVLTRTLAIAFSGLGAGVAGAYLAISSVGSINPALTGGLGFIAFAAFIFGRARPLGTFTASILFAAFSALAIFLQGKDLISSNLLGTLPYLATVAALGFEGVRRNRLEKYDVSTTTYLPAIIPRG